MTDSQPRIGPYRIVRRLGAGGMGEVYLAIDERLGRKVAIKRILPAARASRARRRRLWREAKAAASLSHPAIVQIHDVLTIPEPDGAAVDCIVMEYVEGPTLRQRLKEGELSQQRLIDVARRIASGLAEAHAKGIVHRDLKTENVLLTSSGAPKISDFGIAKRFLPGDDEESLTATQHVVGTSRVMSPEQARGADVDPRSDLFSLGVLLYECFTGVSPFVGENHLDTLSRVLTYDPPPARAVQPELAPELSHLIDHLLHKDPDRRPQSALEVVDALAEIAGTLTAETAPGSRTLPLTVPSSPLLLPTAELTPPAPAAAKRRRPPRAFWLGGAALAGVLAAGGALIIARSTVDPVYVAVAATEVEAGALAADERDLLADAVRFAALRALVGLEGAVVQPPAEVDAALGSTPSAVVAEVGASALLSSKIACPTPRCRISLQRIGGDGGLVWAETFEAPREDLHVLAAAVETFARQAFGELEPRAGAGELVAADDELRDFLDLHRRAELENEPASALLERLAELRRREDRFLEVYLLEADIARRAFFTSRDRKLLERAHGLLADARRLAPEDPRVPALAFNVALTAGELGDAATELERLEDLAPGDASVDGRRALLLESEDRFDEALAVLRRAVDERPSVAALGNLAAMEIRQGRVAAARRTLGRLLARSPGNVGGRSQLAMLELVEGDPAVAAELYRELVAETGGIAELSNLGLAHLLEKEYGRAAEALRMAYERQPMSPQMALNYADALVLLGDEARARPLYARVVDLAERDVDAGSAALLTVRAQALARLGRPREAVAAVQRALQQAPRDAQAAYEAAVVYSLAGETSSALVSAERALELGYGARWFAFPWFDRLRDDPQLAAALGGGEPAK